MSLMKAIPFAMLAILLLSGCASSYPEGRERCESAGYPPGSRHYAECVENSKRFINLPETNDDPHSPK